MSERGTRDLEGAVAAKPSLKAQVGRFRSWAIISSYSPAEAFSKLTFTKPVSEFAWDGKCLPALHY